MEIIIGRTKELKKLEAFTRSSKSKFVVVYGRRRVGKTFLIRKAFDNKFTFQLTGYANVSTKEQLAQFHSAILNYATRINWQPQPAENWFTAFQQLINFLEKLNEPGKKVIFLDELPWLDTPRSKFLAALEHFWNSWASARNDILLIVCGSAASWMINNLIKNRGGLHNRITDRIKLKPFTLQETKLLLEHKNAVYNHYQVLLLYMAFGGIPFYLDFIDASRSAMQNINELCFKEDAPFRLEYENLYASLFKKHERHVSIVQALSTKGKGLTRQEIIERTKLSDGGGLTRLLNELEESNFIRSYKAFGKKQKEALFQLTDLFSLFHLRFINKTGKDDDNWWINQIESPTFFNWAGYAFEMVCLLHLSQIKKALGISGVQTSVANWQSPEAQIDLLIDRKDQVINLCEMKFSINAYTIGKKYSENLRNKLGTFRQATKTRKALFLTFISTYGLKQNQYSGMVQNDLTMEVLFEK